MCRFVAYLGPTIGLEEMIYKPKHSLIHQSVHAHEREEPLNGDGWGIGWYNPEATDAPALYRTVHPAWSDENMRHVAPAVRTPSFLAHVRAATAGLAVGRLNCHPFRGGRHTHDPEHDPSAVEDGRRRLLFMHNGSIGAFHDIVRGLEESLEDPLYHGIQGSTDSEHAFALFQQKLGERAVDPSLEDLAQALVATLAELDARKAEAGKPDASTEANFCVTDGTQLVASRYAHPDPEGAASLYVGTAESFGCDATGYTAAGPAGTGATLIASERLWDDERVWTKVPLDHLVLVDGQGEVSFREIGTAA